MWSWHILHPEAATNGLVNNTRGMFWGPLETGIALEIAHCLLQAHHLAKQPCPAIPLQAQS